MSSLNTAVDRAIERQLTRLGFEKARDGVFLREMAPGFSAWLGIGLASQKRGGEVDADPMVGVRYEPVEALLPSAAPYDATVFRPLYELLPGGGYRTWSFDPESIDEQAASLAEAIEQEAMPFMRSLGSPEAIAEALETWAFADVRRRRLPAFRLAQGDIDAARAEVDRERSQLEDDDPGLLDEYEIFARQLLASRP
jgi:hypothetical protein